MRVATAPTFLIALMAGAPAMAAPANVPAPASLVQLERATHDINLVVAVIGADALAFLDEIHARTKHDSADVQALADGQLAYAYMPVRLGDIRGWHTHIHLYAFPTGDGPPHQLLTQALARADAVIIAQTAADRLGTVRLCAQAAQAHKQALPFVVLGPLEAAREWTRATGRAAVFTSPWAVDRAMAALKAATKAMLTDLRDTQR